MQLTGCKTECNRLVTDREQPQDPECRHESSLWENIGPILLASGAGGASDDETKVRNLVSQLWFSSRGSEPPAYCGGVGGARQATSLGLSAVSGAPDDDEVKQLVGMGFSADAAREALDECGGQLDTALELLLSGMD